MEHDARGCRALSALVVLACLLALSLVGCKKDEDANAGSSPQSLVDGGGAGSGAEDEIENPRVSPDGEDIQVREMPSDECMSSGNYFFCSESLPSTMAIGACWAAGSTLVTINDADENQLLVDQMLEDEYWIGFNDATEEGMWDWAAGSTGSSFDNWDEGQPGLDDFVFMARETGAWSTSTDIPRPYICELWE